MEWDLTVQLGPNPCASHFMTRVLGPSKEEASHSRFHHELWPLQGQSLKHHLSVVILCPQTPASGSWMDQENPCLSISSPSAEAQQGDSYTGQKQEILVINSAYIPPLGWWTWWAGILDYALQIESQTLLKEIRECRWVVSALFFYNTIPFWVLVMCTWHKTWSSDV